MTASELTPTLRAGIRWLHDTEQPDSAALSHHGLSLPVVANRRFTFVPEGAFGRPVVVVEVAKIEWVERGVYRAPGNPLEPGELSDLATLLASLGAESERTWNGNGTTGSVGLKYPAHPTLIAAVNRYRAGCLTHPTEHVFCKCDWYRNGRKLLITPDGAF